MGDQNQNQQPVGAPVMGEVTDPSMPSVTQSPCQHRSRQLWVSQ